MRRLGSLIAAALVAAALPAAAVEMRDYTPAPEPARWLDAGTPEADVAARFGVRGETEYARVSADAPAFERILVGGAPPLLFDDALLSQRIAMPAVPLGIVGGRQALTARVSLTGPVLEPFAWGAKGGEPLGDWYRVIGLETREITAPIPYARVPELRIRTGVVYTLDAPNRHRIQGYGSLVLRP